MSTFIIFFISDPINKLETPKSVGSAYIDCYFSEFKESYYMPNEMLAIEYPDDISYLIN